MVLKKTSRRSGWLLAITVGLWCLSGWSVIAAEAATISKEAVTISKEATTIATEPPLNVIQGEAVFKVTGTIASDKVEPVGVNGMGDGGGLTVSSNNLSAVSNFEPISIRAKRVITAVGPNNEWIEIDNGGTSGWDSFRSGYLSGAEVRIYRLVDTAGNPLPYNDKGELTTDNAANVIKVLDDRVPVPGENGFANGGWIAYRYTNPGNLDGIFHNLDFTDQHYITNGVPNYYIVRAVDRAGNLSAPSEEVMATVDASTASDGPKILGTGKLSFPINTQQRINIDVIGGEAPFSFEVTDLQGQPLQLPEGLSVTTDPSGRLSLLGKTATAITNFQMRVTVTDQRMRQGSRNFMINPENPAGNPDDKEAPSPPTNVRAIAQNGHIYLVWDASPSSDVASYRIFRSEVPGSKQEERCYLNNPNRVPLRKGDIVFFSKVTDGVDKEMISPRIRQWSGNQSEFSGSLNQERVPHPQPIPPDMEKNAGKTALKVTIPNGTHTIWQYVFGNQQDRWYGQLEPGKSYTLSLWMRQEGLAEGKVGFDLGTPTYETAKHTFTGINGDWQLFTHTFTAPSARPTQAPVFGPRLTFYGPGTVWLDQLVLYCSDNDPDDPTMNRPYMPDRRLLDELIASQPPVGHKGALRFFGPMFGQGTMDGYLSYTPDANFNMGVSEPNTSLPVFLEWALRTGSSPETRMVPFITWNVYFSEDEWKNCLEYLAAPYDPAVDTPESKPYAYRRYQQRGVTTPWVQEFRQMIVEFGNETWHNGLYGFEGFGSGKAYGLFARHFFSQWTASPYWASEQLGDKIKLNLGGFYDSGLKAYAETALRQAPMVAQIGHATYVGPKWETGDASPSTFDDAGIQETLVGLVTANQNLFAAQAKTRDDMAAQGYAYDLTAYEGGPSGYALSNLSDEVNEKYGKSLAMGVASVDSFLYASYMGWTYQNFFSYGQGVSWNSHTLRQNGFRPTPGWLGVGLRNQASGAMLVTQELSNVYYDRNAQKIPLIGTYVLRNGNQYALFVLSRKLDGRHGGADFGDGYTPVTVELPFTHPQAIKLFTLTGDPRENNLTAMKITISPEIAVPVAAYDSVNRRFTINEATGGGAQGMPPGSVFLYLFEDTTSLNGLSSRPQVTLALDQGAPAEQKAANGEAQSVAGFYVHFDRPVTGFDDPQTDLVLGGTAEPSGAVITEVYGSKRTSYKVTVTGMKQSGTVTVAVPEGAALAVDGGQASDAAAPLSASFDYLPVAVAAVDQTSGPALFRVRFSHDQSYQHDPAASLVNFTWDFGDGSDPVTVTDQEAVVTHTYTAAGTYKAKLLVTDSKNRQAGDDRVITVKAPLTGKDLFTCTAIEDTFFNAEKPSTPGGKERSAGLGTGNHLLVKFDLMPLKDKTITSAKLRVYFSNTFMEDAFSVALRDLAPSSWSENKATPETIDLNGPVLGEAVIPKNTGSAWRKDWVEWDVTGTLQGIVANDPALLASFALDPTGRDLQRGFFHTRENGADLAAKLLVTYEDNETVMPLVVTSAVWSDGDGHPVDRKHPPATVKPQIRLWNNSSEGATVTMVFALYDQQNVMNDVMYETQEVPARAFAEFQPLLSIPADPQGCYLKVFLWSGLDTMQPLTNGGLTFSLDRGEKDLNADVDLIGYWNFNDASGNTVKDLSGHGNDGTVEQLRLNEGPDGSRALEVKDLSNMVRVPTSESLNSVDTWQRYTVSLWLYLNPVDRPKSRGYIKRGGFKLYLNDPRQFVAFADLGYMQLPQVVIPENKWVHIVTILDGIFLRVYVDGQLVASSFMGVQNFTIKEDLLLGAPNEKWIAPIDGRLDDVRIYRRVLTIDEIRRLGSLGSLEGLGR
ncbi:LamG-like jellyroll fold domain-containing protein [Heliophilum fasciatum]|uniref:PKD domain-containing protein n=1 Tax=Heliophilum fasciatum TaxID=35700 RepID=A0A4R2RJE1_9FIRM|nr:LamG-like jellyroll fold domain-containing protein [Heliophilum fasciatum]MCW2278227.1 PKD repeat protein [Heliophilum fasciatum]TCP63952.1 PKD domain-containing protein [Heliophilum fasciatum]